MSLKHKISRVKKSGSRARSLFHKYDGHKMTTVVNHIHFTRHHGFESTKHKNKHDSSIPSAQVG